MRNLFVLLRFVRPYEKYMLFGPVFKLFEAILELLLPLLMVRMVDIGIANGDQSFMIKTGLQMFFIATIGFLSALICQYSASIASQGFGTNLRNRLFEKIVAFSRKEIDDFGTSTLSNRLVNDINQLQLAVAMLIRLVIRAPFLSIGGIIMAMFLDLRLSFIIAGILPIFLIILIITILKTMPLYRKLQQKLDQLTSIIRENLNGVRVIRAFVSEKSETRRFQYENHDYMQYAIYIGKISSLLNPLTQFIMNMGIVCILWFGGLRVHSGTLTTGKIIAYINYMTLILASFIIVSQMIVLYTKSFVSAARVVEILDTDISLKDFDENSSPNVPDSSSSYKGPMVEFRNVCMNYEQSAENELEDISFQIEAGEAIGIVGATGSGKSTLVHLLSRHYDATGGSILINGLNISQYPLLELRKMIALVPQKISLLSGTVTDNLKLGNPSADTPQMLAAAEAAQCATFIEQLPDGYDTILAKGGHNLSGGQRQRLTIARALLKEAPILILDDSFHALDYVTTKKIQDALPHYTTHATVFVVSQRIGIVQHLNRILVLNDGHLEGFGTHNELMTSCNAYVELYLSQQETEKGEHLEA